MGNLFSCCTRAQHDGFTLPSISSPRPPRALRAAFPGEFSATPGEEDILAPDELALCRRQLNDVEVDLREVGLNTAVKSSLLNVKAALLHRETLFEQKLKKGSEHGGDAGACREVVIMLGTAGLTINLSLQVLLSSRFSCGSATKATILT